MGSPYNDVLLDFDLDFLNQNTGSSAVPPEKNDKFRKQVLLAKKRTIAVDSLIKKCYEIKEEKLFIEKQLLDSKEECKQACIKFNNAMQKVSHLEEKDVKLESSYKELQAAYSLSENRCQAIQCHANQLQLLVRENEKKLESLAIENQLDKTCKKDFDKKISALEKELLALEDKVDELGTAKHDLNQDILALSDVVLGKKKLNNEVKLLLNKYVGGYNNVTDEEDSDAENSKHSIEESFKAEKLHCKSDNITKSDGMAVCPEIKKEEIVKAFDTKSKPEVTIEICDEYHDSENSNGIISGEDTGRGSSLTYSDSEKCLQSPDYFSADSHLSLEPIKSVCSSKSVVETAHKATSPIIFEHVSLQQATTQYTQMKNAATSPIANIQMKNAATSPIANIQMKNAATSPMADIQMKDAATSPMANRFYKNMTESVENHNTVQDDHSAKSDATLMMHKSMNSSDSVKAAKKVLDEKNYLELNNSNLLCLNENSEDYEVTRILNTMTLHKTLITPLPPSPNPTSNTNITESISNIESTESAGFKMLYQHIVKILADVQDIKCKLLKQSDQKKYENKIQKKKVTKCNTNENSEKKVVKNCDDKHNFRNLFGDEENDSVISNNVQISIDVPINGPELVIDSRVLNNRNDMSVKEHIQSVNERLLLEEPLLMDKNVNQQSETNHDVVNSKPIVPEISQNCDINLNLEVESNNNRVRKACTKKVSKLDKLRKGLQPRCKIRPVDAPAKKVKCQLPSRAQASKELMERIKNKSAYEKALVVVAEFRAKQKLKIENPNKNNIKQPNAKPVVNLVVNASKSIIKPSNVKDIIPLIEVNNGNTSEYSEMVIPNNLEDKMNVKTNKEKDESQHALKCIPPLIEKPQLNSIIESKKDCCSEISELLPSSVTTLSQSQIVEKVPTACESVQIIEIPKLLNKLNQNNDKEVQAIKGTTPVKAVNRRSSLKRSCSDKSDVQPKRILRSSFSRLVESEPAPIKNDVDVTRTETYCKEERTDYSDLQLFTGFSETVSDNNVCNVDTNSVNESVLLKMINKYGIHNKTKFVKKIPVNRTNQICTKLNEEILKISALQGEAVKIAMNKLVTDIQSWKYKHFMSGFIKYLIEPDRKTELFNKNCAPPSPPMTKQEQILLYVITQLQISNHQGWSTTVTDVLKNIEYTIFRLNHTPDFNTIESLSHFYALLCRYTRAKNRLRLFMLDAMYCISFKAIPLIRQCIDVWSHVIPLAKLRIGKTPLVLCLVYLLHFYKCNDLFNRVQEIRLILNRRYSFDMGEWNETQILKMLRNAVLELRDIPIEKKMLRIGLILIAKRHGPQWSQKNIVKNLLLSLIEKNDVPVRIKLFCLSVLGPILKPFPNDMKVHCEIVMKQLIHMLEQNCSHDIEEAIITSLIYMNKKNSLRIDKALLSWKPQNEISPDLEELMRDFVRDRPIKVWKRTLQAAVNSK